MSSGPVFGILELEELLAALEDAELEELEELKELELGLFVDWFEEELFEEELLSELEELFEEFEPELSIRLFSA